MKNLFDKQDLQDTIARIHQLDSTTQAQWGKMSVDQMLAHCNVAYETIYEDKHPRPNALMRFFLKTFVKGAVCGPKPYPKNSRTAPQYIITGSRDFEKEKQRLINFLEKTQALGAGHFDGRDYPSFGKLNAQEWNVLFSKHLDHHLTQFGV